MALEEKARKALSAEESVRTQPYDCGTGKPIKAPVGHVTAGIGRNFDANPLSVDEINLLFRNDFLRALSAAERIFGAEAFRGFSENRQVALACMAFQLGEQGLADFKEMREAIAKGDWRAAGLHALNSKWAREDCPARAQRVHKMLAFDSFPY